MGRPCSICVLPNRDAIDAALIRREPNRRIATQYGLTEPSVRRHRNGHLPASLARAHDAQEEAWGDDLLDQLRTLQERTLRIMTVADAAGDVRTALVAITVARGNLAMLASLWSVPGRPAWWTGEPRWTPPPDPAAKMQALSESVAELPEYLKAEIRAWFMERHEQYLAERRAVAQAKMESYLPPVEPGGNGDGPR